MEKEDSFRHISIVAKAREIAWYVRSVFSLSINFKKTIDKLGHFKSCMTRIIKDVNIIMCKIEGTGCVMFQKET